MNNLSKNGPWGSSLAGAVLGGAVAAYMLFMGRAQEAPASETASPPRRMAPPAPTPAAATLPAQQKLTPAFAAPGRQAAAQKESATTLGNKLLEHKNTINQGTDDNHPLDLLAAYNIIKESGLKGSELDSALAYAGYGMDQSAFYGEMKTALAGQKKSIDTRLHEYNSWGTMTPYEACVLIKDINLYLSYLQRTAGDENVSTLSQDELPKIAEPYGQQISSMRRENSACMPGP